jgi:ABC-type glutathione transport system ATPase component
MSIADQLYLIDQGAVVTSGTYDDLMKNCQSEREIAILRAVSSLDSLRQTPVQLS